MSNDYPISGLINPQDKKDLEKLIADLNEASKVAKTVVIGSGDAKNLKQVAEAQEKINKSQREAESHAKKIEAMNQRIAVTAQKEADRIEATRKKNADAELKRLDKEAQAQRKVTEQAEKTAQAQNKLITAFKNAPTGSITQLSSANAILNQRLKNVNQTTEDGARKANNLRSAIDKNQAKITSFGTTADKQRSNIGNYASAVDGLKTTWNRFTGVFVGVTALFGAGAVAGKIFNGAINSLNSTADKFAMVQEGAKQAVDSFFRSIMEGDWSNLIDNMRVAYEEGKRYADMLDLIGDMTLARQVSESAIDAEISKLMVLVKSRRTDLVDRKKYIDEIKRLEKKKLDEELEISNMSVKNEETNAVIKSKLTSQALRKLVSNKEYSQAMSDGLELYKKLSAQATEIQQVGTLTNPVMMNVVNQEKLNRLIQQQTKEEQMKIFYAVRYDRLGDASRKKLAETYISQTNAQKKYTDGLQTIARLENKINREVESDRKEEESERNKAYEDRKKKEKALLDYKIKINTYEIESQQAIVDNEKNTGDKRIDASDVVLNKKIENLKLEFEYNKKYADSKEEQTNLETIYLKEKENVRTESEKAQTKIIGDETTKRAEIIKKAIENETNGVQKLVTENEIAKNKEFENNANRYTKGEQSLEDYEKNKLKIEAKYAKEHLQLMLKIAEAELNILETDTDIDDADLKRISELRVEISKLKNEIATPDLKGDDKWLEKFTSNLEKAYEKATEITTAISDLFSAMTEKKVAEIDLEIEKNTEAKDKEIENLDAMLANESISRKNYDKQKQKIEANAKKREDKYLRDKAKIEYDAEMWKWRLSFATITLNTAIAVIKAAPNPVAMALAGVVGAAALVTAGLSKPVAPKFKTGTNFHEGGLATVGDGGREILKMPDGNSYLASSEITASFPRGMKVLKNSDTEKVLKSGITVEQTSFDVSELKTEQQKTNKYLQKIAGKQTINRIFVQDNSQYNRAKWQ